MDRAIYVTEHDFEFKRVYDKDVKEKFSSLFDIKDVSYNKEELLKGDFKNVKFIFGTWWMPILTKEEIKNIFPSLKAIFYSAGTVQYFAKPYLELNIKIFSSWQANAIPVIEYATSQILLASKGFFHLSTWCKNDYDEAYKIKNNFPGNYNTKIGILGYGAIAKGVVKALITHKLDIYVFAPNLSLDEANYLHIHKVNSLDDIFSNCTVISNHIANLPSTINIINKPLIEKLHDYQTFINTGRGQQVDETALINKLENTPKLFAVLDVTWPEPPLKGSKLYSLKNVILTPHIAGSSGNEVVRMSSYMYDEVKRYLNQEDPLYEVTLPMLKTLA